MKTAMATEKDHEQPEWSQEDEGDLSNDLKGRLQWVGNDFQSFPGRITDSRS